jgi:hypothetical protein
LESQFQSAPAAFEENASVGSNGLVVEINRLMGVRNMICETIRANRMRFCAKGNAVLATVHGVGLIGHALISRITGFLPAAASRPGR